MMPTQSPNTGPKAYNVYRQWGTRLYKSCDTEKEAWDALDELVFGEGYEVRDAQDNIRVEFVPF